MYASVEFDEKKKAVVSNVDGDDFVEAAAGGRREDPGQAKKASTTKTTSKQEMWQCYQKWLLKRSKSVILGFLEFWHFPSIMVAFSRHISKAILDYSKTGSSSNRSKKKAAATTSTRAGVVH